MVEDARVSSVDALYFREWRNAAGLSLREFCRRFRERTGIGLADSNLSAMEQGRRPFPDHVIALGASLLGREPVDFPEYRLRHIPPETLTDPFIDRILRRIAAFPHLSLYEQGELNAAARVLELMEEEMQYRTE